MSVPKKCKVKKKLQYKLSFEKEKNEYLNRFQENLNLMRKEKQLCDFKIMLHGDDDSFVHSIMLLNFKEGLNQILQYTNMKSICILKESGITSSILDVMIQLVYEGRVHLTMHNISDIIEAARKLNLHEIVLQCEKYLKRKLTPSNCMSIYKFTQCYKLEYLEVQTFKYLLKHFIQVIQTDNFLNMLDYEALCYLLGNNLLNIPKEEDLIQPIIKWTEFDLNLRKPFLINLLSKVRLGLIKQELSELDIFYHPLIQDIKPNKSNALSSYINDKANMPRTPASIIVSVCGWSNLRPTSTMEAYDPRAEKWFIIKQNELITPRSCHAVATVKSFIFLIGGYRADDCLSSVKCFDADLQVWSTKAPLNESRCYISAVTYKDLIYVIGGFNYQTKSSKTCEVYDFKTNKWTYFANMLEKRSDAAATVHKDKIYVSGGFNCMRIQETAEVYDPKTNQWTNICNMISPRSGHSLISFCGQLYAIAGFDGFYILKSVERYDTTCDRWLSSVPVIVPRSNFATVVLEDKVFIIGGFNGKAPITEVEILDEELQWKKCCDMQVQRSAFGACVLSELDNAYLYSAFNNPDGILN